MLVLHLQVAQRPMFLKITETRLSNSRKEEYRTNYVQKYGDYSDLICLVKNVDPVKPIAKRYFIEDLGSKDDFDFNDIVVDVIQDPDGNH